MYEALSGQVGVVVPPECAGSPEFATCVMSALQKASQVPECAFAGAGKDKCVTYYHELYIYEDCRGLCSTLKKPEKPASWTESPPTSSNKSSAGGWLVAGILIAGAALAVAASVRKT